MVTNQIPNYRWLRISIGLGLALAVLLLANSVWTYRMVSRRVVVDQLRRDLAMQVVAADQHIQRGGPRSADQLGALLDQMHRNSGGKIAWAQLRDSQDGVIAQAGLAMDPMFSAEYVRAQLRSRRPVFKTLDSEAGEVVVEAFPIRLPAGIAPAVFRLVAAEAPGRPQRNFGVLEIAAYLNAGRASLWPLQRSLIINFSAALALLLSLIVIRARLRSYLSGRQLQRQVEIARQVQQDLLPASLDVSEGFECAADCVSAAHVGGDFYDVFPVTGNGSAFVVGDVSGKGVPAALLTGVIHGAVRSSGWTESARHHEDATIRLNRLLCERTAQERFVTMFWSYFDPGTRLLRYINAGHFAPALFRAAQPGAPLRLAEGGPVLGLLPEARYSQGVVRLEAGDLLVLFSDGIVEAANSRDEQFGEDRLMAAIATQMEGTPENVRDRVLSDVEQFTGQAAPDDDRTLLVIRYQGMETRIQNRPLAA